jgi:hypothetical protein
LLGGLVVVGIFWGAGGWREKSIEHRLAAIYAAHALGPEENAATIYYRLLAPDLPAHLRVPAGLPMDSSSGPVPQFSEEECIKLLLEAARRPQCSFPALCDSAQPVAAMRWTQSTANTRNHRMIPWAQSVLTVAFDDLEQGRLDAGREKLRCLAQMAARLRQQPAKLDFITAGVIEEFLWSALAEFIVERDATDKHLAMIEEIMPSLTDAWEAESGEMRQVEIMLDTRSAWERLSSLIDAKSPQRYIKERARMYRDTICERRGVRILIELRRYRNQSGRWPRTLDEIRTQLPPETLSCLLGRGELVYEPEPGGFHLGAVRSVSGKNVGGWGLQPTYSIWPWRGTLKWLQDRQWDTPQAAGGQSTQRMR